MLINIKDFDVSEFNILRLTSSTLFNNIFNKKRFYLISSKKEIVKITSTTNETLDIRL